MVIRHTVSDEESGRKVLSLLRRTLSLSATMVRRLKQADAIALNGVSVYTDRTVSAGDVLSADLSVAESECDLVPEEGSLTVLFENDGLLAVNKPAGLLVHPSRSRYTGTLANLVAGYLEKATGDGRCHAVNRLDRDTSGVVLFAKNSHMKASASAALAAPEASKEYLAFVEGSITPPYGTIDLPIRREQEINMRRITAPDGQRAVTHYETTGFYTKGGNLLTRLRLILETGRTHQIRVHCLAVGHPILGDGLYYTDSSRALSERLSIGTQALHACKLTFRDPLTYKLLAIEAPVPERLLLIEKECGPDRESP